jgi:hypothetical protein
MVKDYAHRSGTWRAHSWCMPGASDWTCSHCGAANKGFSQVCLGCSREKGTIVTRGLIWSAVGALVVGLGLATVLVYTFRSPSLETRLAEQPAAATVVLPPAPDPQPSAPPPTVAAVPSRFVPTPAPRPVPPTRVTRSGDPTQDPIYLLRLREKRVNELRTRMAGARTRDERETLGVWLDDALHDLSEARREARF